MQAADREDMNDAVGPVQFFQICIQHPLFSQEHSLHNGSIRLIITGIQQKRKIFPDQIQILPKAAICAAFYHKPALHKPALLPQGLIVVGGIEFSRICGVPESAETTLHDDKTADFRQIIFLHIAQNAIHSPGILSS